jgi:hypothetical protein
MWIIDCYELLNIVNKAIGVDKEWELFIKQKGYG